MKHRLYKARIRYIIEDATTVLESSKAPGHEKKLRKLIADAERKIFSYEKEES